jgi:hypothetical protein
MPSYPFAIGSVLAFFIGAAIVADGNFVDGSLAFGELDGELGLDAETVGVLSVRLLRRNLRRGS